MAARFVRKTGSDSNGGTSKTDAFLTVGKALGASGIASGDVLYIGAGTYRENATVSMTDPVATTFIYGDVDGSQTGDTGEVIITAYVTNDTTAPVGASAIDLNGRSNLDIERLILVGGTSQCINGTTTNSRNITLRDLSLLGTTATIKYTGLADVASNWIIERVSVPAGTQNVVNIILPTSASADYDSNFVIRNCACLTSGSPWVNVTTSGASSFKGGGVYIGECECLSAGQSVIATANVSVQIPIIVHDCILNGNFNNLQAAANGQIVEHNNRILPTSARSNVSISPYSVVGSTYSHAVTGWWDGQVGRSVRPFHTPLSGSPLLGVTNSLVLAGRTATVTDDATVGTIAWTTPANASVPDGTSTTATNIPITTGISHYLNAQGFTGFAGIPSDATIKSIRVEAIVAATAASAVACSSVKLLKAGVIVGNDLASSNTTQFSVAATIQSWGSTADPLWGTTWTVAQVQAATFGAVWAAKNTSGTLRGCTVDFLRVTVAYTTADGAGGVATDMLGNPRPAGGNSTALAVGALERGNTASVQTSTVHTGGGGAWKITGPGYHDLRCNVDAASTVLGVYARYDTAAQQPTVTLKAAPELGIAADVPLTWSDPGANAWAQFTTTTVPTAAGVVTLRLATAANTGISYFDDFSAT